jgi:hypothetical protein
MQIHVSYGTYAQFEFTDNLWDEADHRFIIRALILYTALPIFCLFHGLVTHNINSLHFFIFSWPEAAYNHRGREITSVLIQMSVTFTLACDVFPYF